MKIILSHTTSFPFHNPGGIEKFHYSLAKQLVMNGVEVEIVTSSGASKVRTEIYENIKYTFLSPRNIDGGSTGKILFGFNLAKYLKSVKFDLLLCSNNTIAPYLSFFNNKGIVIFQGFDYELTFNTWKNQLSGLSKLFYLITREKPLRYCLHHANVIAVSSDSEAKTIVEMGFDKTKIFKMSTGIDILQIQKTLKNPVITRKDLGFNEDELIILYVNRFLPERGANYLVDAFKIIKKEIKNAKLILIGRAMWAGEKIFYNAIINQINELGIKDDVYVKANIPENVLLYYYAISDIYVSPTIRDDPFLLMGTQDAMACGLPVIMTSSAPSITLMPNGYMVPKANPNGIANAVLKMCENQNYKAMGKLSQQLAKEYDIEVIAKKLIELCKKFECNLK